MFQKFHIGKNGQTSDPKSKSIMDQVEEKATQVQVGEGDVPIDKDAIYEEVHLLEKGRNRVPKFVQNMESEQLRQAREELDKARTETLEVRALAEASTRRADESDKKFLDLQADMLSFERELALLKRMFQASGHSVSLQDFGTQDYNA